MAGRHDVTRLVAGDKTQATGPLWEIQRAGVDGPLGSVSPDGFRPRPTRAQQQAPALRAALRRVHSSISATAIRRTTAQVRIDSQHVCAHSLDAGMSTSNQSPSFTCGRWIPGRGRNTRGLISLIDDAATFHSNIDLLAESSIAAASPLGSVARIYVLRSRQSPGFLRMSLARTNIRIDLRSHGRESGHLSLRNGGSPIWTPVGHR